MTTEERTAIQAKIDGLPSGGISNKTINGKTYAYYQWTENGKQRSRRVKDEEFAELAAGKASEMTAVFSSLCARSSSSRRSLRPCLSIRF